jgi:hypothetical protein
MTKSGQRMLLAFLVAAASVFGLSWFWLGYLMRTMPAMVETTVYAACAVIVVGFCVALMNAARPVRGWQYGLALAMMLGGAAAPFAVDATRAMIEEWQERAERQALEVKFLAQLVAYKKDVAERAAAKKPFTLREAKDFLDFVQGSDLGYRLLPDHSPQAFALLKAALDGKVFDPNVRLKGPRPVDVAEEPLFVLYYKFHLQAGATMPVPRVREREWRIFQMLIAGGANLDDPAARVLRDAVRRETEPYDPNVPGYVRLK